MKIYGSRMWYKGIALQINMEGKGNGWEWVWRERLDPIVNEGV